MDGKSESTGSVVIKDGFQIPTDNELDTTLRVLDYLQKHGWVSWVATTDPLSDVIVIKAQCSVDHSIQTSQHRSFRKQEEIRKTNRKYDAISAGNSLLSTAEAHELYPSLCRQCGKIKTGCSELSLPEKLNLPGKFALIIGGRINLGYATALRLLCGANVIVPSRYPADAVHRTHRSLILTNGTQS